MTFVQRSCGSVFRICVGLFAVGSMVVLFLPAANALVIEQTQSRTVAVPEVERFDDWTMTCIRLPNEKAKCQLQPAHQVDETTLSAVIVPAADGDRRGNLDRSPVLILRTPLGVLLPGGVEMVVDGRRHGRLAFQACETSGCVAPVPMSGALGNALRRGLKLEAGVRRRDGIMSNATISLTGLTSALAALEDAGK